MENELTISDRLYKAGDIIRAKGHLKEAFHDFTESSCCYAGAVVEAMDRAVYLTQIPEVEDLIEMSIADEELDTESRWVNRVFNFNDNPKTTKDDVIQSCDAAYVLALQEEGVDLDEYFNEG